MAEARFKTEQVKSLCQQTFLKIDLVEERWIAKDLKQWLQGAKYDFNSTSWINWMFQQEFDEKEAIGKFYLSWGCKFSREEAEKCRLPVRKILQLAEETKDVFMTLSEDDIYRITRER